MNQIIRLLACLPLLLAGCATRSGVTVDMVNVRLAGATAFESTATFTLRLSNETSETVRVTGGVHKIYLNGLYIGKGLSNESLEIQRLATATQVVTVHINNIAMATRVKPIVESRSFSYRIQSKVYSSGGNMSSVSEGTLDAKDFMPSHPPGNSIAPVQQ